MKGVIFNLLEDAVIDEHGLQAWAGLVDNAGLKGGWSSLGSYPDAELLALVEGAATALGQPIPDILRWFGQRALPLLAARYPGLFAGHRGSRSFIRSINDIIHPEVRKLHPGAACPHFHFHDLDDGRMVLAYQSPRRLCRLAEGFAQGAAAHYGETIFIEHMSCMIDGDPVCRIALEWPA